jgi:hypothetical protein
VPFTSTGGAPCVPCLALLSLIIFSYQIQAQNNSLKSFKITHISAKPSFIDPSPQPYSGTLSIDPIKKQISINYKVTDSSYQTSTIFLSGNLNEILSQQEGNWALLGLNEEREDVEVLFRFLVSIKTITVRSKIKTSDSLYFDLIYYFRGVR